MAKNKCREQLHRDFQYIPIFTFHFHAVFAVLMNGLIKISRYLQTRKIITDVSCYSVKTEDGYLAKVRVLRPENLSDNAPVLLYYHGGAFMLTYSAQHINMVSQYAVSANAVAVFVEYRLGPKYVYPTGFNDCYAAYQWVLANAETLNINPKKIALGGDSAGGAMAISVAMRGRDEGLAKPCGQMLIYPVLDSSCSTKSAIDFVDVPLWNAKSNQKMWAMYLKNQAMLSDQILQYASPIDAKLDDLPATYIESAEFDPLRDESHQLADKLEALDISVVLNKTQSTIHGFDLVTRNGLVQQSMQARSTFLQKIFNT